MQAKKPNKRFLFELFCVNSSVSRSERESKYAIERLRIILEYPDLTRSDAEVFRQAISKIEAVIDVIDSVTKELGTTELSKIPMAPDDVPF